MVCELIKHLILITYEDKYVLNMTAKHVSLKYSTDSCMLTKAVRISSIGSEVQNEINLLAFYMNFIEPVRYLICLSRTLLRIYSQFGVHKQCGVNFSLICAPVAYKKYLN